MAGTCLLGTQGDPNFFFRFVLLVSGLGLGSGGGESLLGTQLLVDMMTGQLGDEGEQCSAAHISRVILAGNLLSHSTQGRDSINKVQPAASCSWTAGHRWMVWRQQPAVPGDSLWGWGPASAQALLSEAVGACALLCSQPPRRRLWTSF